MGDTALALAILAGEMFTAADISVTYALELAKRSGGLVLGEAERAYLTRMSGREAYKRAMGDMSADAGVGRKGRRPATASRS